MTPAEFAKECDAAAKQLRRLPSDLRRALARDVRDKVAAPLADKVRAAGTGVYGTRVAGTTKVRAGADPTIVLGGAKRIASGGAKGRDLVFGTEFGGHSRVTAIPRTSRRAGHRRRSTRQFARGRSPFIFRTVARNLDTTFDTWCDLIDEHLDEELRRG